MLTFSTTILKFGDKGEKTGWRYIEVPLDITEELMPGNRKSFRVRGFLDQERFEGVALVPMGEGAFIMALNAAMRKAVRKEEGAVIQVKMEVHEGFFLVMPPELEEYLDDDEAAQTYFNSLSRGMQNYFLNWIGSAKTAETRLKRIVNTANAMSAKQDFGQMVRSLKKVRS